MSEEKVRSCNTCLYGHIESREVFEKNQYITVFDRYCCKDVEEKEKEIEKNAGNQFYCQGEPLILLKHYIEDSDYFEENNPCRYWKPDKPDKG